MKDYRLQIRIRNNRILERIEESGFSSVAAFCKEFDLPYLPTTELVRMASPARNRITGEWRELATKVAFALEVLPEELFNERQANEGVRQRTVERYADESEVRAIMSSDLPRIETTIEHKDLVRKAITRCSERERDVLMKRFGLDGQPASSFSDIAEEQGCSIERIRQIELKALRKAKRFCKNVLRQNSLNAA